MGKEIRPNTKVALKEAFPQIWKFLDGEDFGWSSVDKKLESFTEDLKLKFQNKQEFEHSLFTIYTQSKGECEYASKAIVEFIKSIFSDLNTLLPKAKKAQLRGTVHALLSNHNQDYKNYIGELAVLVWLIKNEGLEFVENEHRLENGKSLDFLMKDATGSDHLIEVVNICNVPSRKNLQTVDEVGKFFKKRAEDKIRSKFGDAPVPPGFRLIMVAWYFLGIQGRMTHKYFSFNPDWPEYVSFPFLAYKTKLKDNSVRVIFDRIDRIPYRLRGLPLKNTP